MVGELKRTLAGLTDKRTGENMQYSMETIGLSAFSVFFTQSPSFLAHQRTMEQNKGSSNAQTLFQVEKTPSDNHIRDMLDPVEPQAIYPVYDRVYEAFEEQGILDTFRWCEVTVTAKGKQIHHNAFITDFTITDENVAGIVTAGRARWKIENENNNTLKKRGYHLEHNFGHGKKHLSSLLATLNILAFLFHSFLTFCDDAYRLIRVTLPTRETFFQDIRALMRYMCFPSWEALMDFMMRGLEIGPYEVK
ncbi:MAG: hypothetical protein O2901_03490 [Verrucomicrobia bacterium]|nr:hypothetical protein [Verrucomicrobiota bacterium]